jgi:TolA-binding protein
MEMRSGYRLLAGSLIVFAVFPCAVDTSPRFLPGYTPEKLDKAFVQGQLGILVPTLSEKYKLIAWRYLAGLPLNSDEQAAVLVPPPTDDPYNEFGAIRGWRTASQALGAAAAPFYGGKASRLDRGVYYINCLPDAFTTAAKTLADRRERYANVTLLTTWANAQGQVFENCMSEAPVYPPNPESGWPELARADRMYQIAAAHFYAEDLEGAEQRFRAIAADSNSPWRDTAAYMVARTLVREDSRLHKPDALAQARARLEKIPSGPFFHPAQVMLASVKTYADPAAGLKLLADKLSVPHPGADIAAAINEATFVLVSDRWAKVLARPGMPDPFDWVHALKSHRPDVAIQEWRKSHSQVWLAAALMLSDVKQNDAKQTDAPELIDAALKVPATSPAYDTVTYNAIRLMIGGGRIAEARRRLNLLLSGKRRDLDSVDNAFRAERMSLATSFDDFLRWAARRPIGIGEDDFFYTDKVDDSPVLDLDSVAVFNYFTPLGRLAEAAESARLPYWPRTQIAISAWTRALVLGDDATGDRIAPALEEMRPGWKPDLEAFRNATGDAKRFAGALAVGRHSSMTVELFSDFPPQTSGGPWDSSWWCAESFPKPTNHAPPDAVLAGPERTAAEDEVRLLHDSGPAQNSMAPIIMSWAQAHPDDQRVPEALHRLVRMTRYGCRVGTDNGPISKAAFDLLHSRYPESTWAKQTPYWFK